MEKIEAFGIPMIQAKTGSDTPMCANVDMYSGLVYTMLGIPEDVFTPLFASARIAGWCANRMEEVLTCHRIMRPAYRAMTKRVHYEPMSARPEHYATRRAEPRPPQKNHPAPRRSPGAGRFLPGLETIKYKETLEMCHKRGPRDVFIVEGLLPGGP